MSTEIIEKEKKENEPIWTRKQRAILDLFAVLGLVNLVVYFIVQNSFVMQNIYWAYSIFTAVDFIGFVLTIWASEERERVSNSHLSPDYNKRTKPLPTRLKTAMVVTGLWLISIPVVIVSYYLPIVPWGDILTFFWNLSLILGTGYDVTYVIVVIGIWLTQGMEWSSRRR